jgi:hypothetical protein
MKKLYLIICMLILVCLIHGNIRAEGFEGDKKFYWSGGINRDTLSSANYNGRFLLRDDNTLKPYLLTGGYLNWLSAPKIVQSKTTLKDIESYGVGVNVGTGLLWSISDGMSFFAEPSFRYKLYDKKLNSYNGSLSDPSPENSEENLKMGIHLGF